MKEHPGSQLPMKSNINDIELLLPRPGQALNEEQREIELVKFNM